jgi:hypothetical protein
VLFSLTLIGILTTPPTNTYNREKKRYLNNTADETCNRERSPAPKACTLQNCTAGATYTLSFSVINDVGESKESDTALVKCGTGERTISTWYDQATVRITETII